MMIGNLLAAAAMEEGLNVTYLPVYGPEMRGGTANCTVVVSEEDIGSPIIHRPTSLIIMNRPSLDKFQPRLQNKGKQVLNSSLIDSELAEKDRVRTFCIEANAIADRLGNTRMANMVALGAYIKSTGVLPISRVQSSLDQVIPSHRAKLIPKNREAIQAGADEVIEIN